MRSLLFTGCLLIVKLCFAQNYHHNVFSIRLTLADTINARTKLELFLQKRTQGTVSNPDNLFKSNQFNSVAFWLNFKVGKSSKLSFSPIGYSENYLLNAKPNDERLAPVKEYRISTRYTNDQKTRIVNYGNRYGLEYRIRDLQHNDVYKSNFRVRYMAKLEKPVYGILSHQRPVCFELNDEVFLQFGNAVHDHPNVFDQNRIYLGFNYEVFKNFKTSLGYIYGIQERNTGDEFDNVNMFLLDLTFDNLITQFKKAKH